MRTFSLFPPGVLEQQEVFKLGYKPSVYTFMFANSTHNNYGHLDSINEGRK